MKTKEKIANDAQEWYQMVRQDLSKWNSEAHPDDRLSWGDWLGELYRTVTYGYMVVRNDDAPTGYGIERVV